MLQILREHSPPLAQFFEAFGEEFTVSKAWIGANESGYQDWHGDGSRREVIGRGIGSLLSYNKMMWFRDKVTGASFGLRVEHCTTIFMTRAGSGMDGNIQHSITGAEKSFLLAMDLAPKNK
jgi:hypothetical protein